MTKAADLHCGFFILFVPKGQNRGISCKNICVQFGDVVSKWRLGQSLPAERSLPKLRALESFLEARGALTSRLPHLIRHSNVVHEIDRSDRLGCFAITTSDPCGSERHPWSQYNASVAASTDPDEAKRILHAAARILGWFRKDKRHEYARYADLIDKHVVGKSDLANTALDFLTDAKILSRGDKLYYLNIDELEATGISYTKIKSREFSDKAIAKVKEWLGKSR